MDEVCADLCLIWTICDQITELLLILR